MSLWNVDDPVHPVLQRAHKDALSAIYGLAFDPSGTMLAAASGDGLEWGWSVPTGQTLFDLDGGFGQAYETRFAAGGRLLLGTGLNGDIRVWEPRVAEARATLCRRIGDPLTATETSRYLPGIAAAKPCA